MCGRNGSFMGGEGLRVGRDWLWDGENEREVMRGMLRGLVGRDRREGINTEGYAEGSSGFAATVLVRAVGASVVFAVAVRWEKADVGVGGWGWGVVRMAGAVR